MKCVKNRENLQKNYPPKKSAKWRYWQEAPLVLLLPQICLTKTLTNVARDNYNVRQPQSRHAQKLWPCKCNAYFQQIPGTETAKSTTQWQAGMSHHPNILWIIYWRLLWVYCLILCFHSGLLWKNQQWLYPEAQE